MSKKSKAAPNASSGVRKSSKAGGSMIKRTAGSNSEPDTPGGAPKEPSKQQQLAALIVRDKGATLDQMIAVTGWLPHTTRAAMTGLRKKGYAISSDKVDGVRTYRGIAPE
jgi:hypothetical protein